MENLPNWISRRNLFAVMISIGIVQIAAYYVAGMLASPDGGMAVAQPDTLLYCQAARRIVEGHPFSFSEGVAMSTGTTSVLYPFVLAVPYWLGATGDSLILAGFVLNALFYLVFLLGWGLAIGRWVESSLARLSAGLLIALSGQSAYCSLAQSDIGCWLAISGLLAAALACECRWAVCVLLVLAPWVRPEGMICVMAFGLFVGIALLGRLLKNKCLRRPNVGVDVLLAVISCLSVAGVFILNYCLTGEPQFSSVAHKGYFKLYPFAHGVCRMTTDLLAMVRELVLGIPRAMPRDLFTIPVLGGVCLVVGVFAYPWRVSRGRWSLGIYLVACAGGFLTVSYSGWQNTNMDRYLAWIFPLLSIFIAMGIEFLATRLPKTSCRGLPYVVFVGAYGAMALALCFVFHCNAQRYDVIRQFAADCEGVLPAKASVGAGSCGVAYFMGARRFAHLPGIYSPEFLCRKSETSYVSLLKHEPQTRFEYWYGELGLFKSLFGVFDESAAGQIVVNGPLDLVLRKADWSGWDIPPEYPKDMDLSARIRIGYESDEKRFDYEIIDRYGRRAFPPFVQTGVLDGKTVVECGRVLVGGDAMTVPLEVNRDVRVVMRTYPSQSVNVTDGVGSERVEYGFANPLLARIRVNDAEVSVVSMKYATNGFSDVTFTIPAQAIKSSPARIAILGDHITCGYWFFQ